MKKSLLNKMAKAASVALVAGAMVCGASLTNVNAAKVNNDAKAEMHMTKKGKLGTARKPAAKKQVKKVTKKGNKKAASKKGLKKHVNRAKKSVKKARKHVAKKTVRRSHAKKSVKKLNKRTRKSVRRNRRARRAYRRVVRHAVKPMNRRAYRHEQVRRGVKNFRHTAYYHKVWSHAEKVNKKGMNFDLRAAKFDQKKGYKRAAKNALYHAHKLNWWVNHDVHMLNLAK